MKKTHCLLAINPGSTSTKVSFFQNLDCISSKTLRHNTEELEENNTVIKQYMFRKQAIVEYMEEQSIDSRTLDAVVGRGGLLKPLKGGIYRVNELMLDDLRHARYGQHASNLGAIIANEIAVENNIPAYVVDPVIVDEFEPLARYSGHPDIPRISVFHALNHKAIARKATADMGKRYEEANLIIAHLGGGISVAAHKKGRAVDASNALEEGPFSPERTGSLPMQQLVERCFSGKYTKDEIKIMLVGKGGVNAYLGTSDCKDVGDRALAGELDSSRVIEAMSYQVAKEIGAYSTILAGEVDRIVITGGLAHSSLIVNWIKERVTFIAPVVVYPGEDEMQSMAEGAYRALIGEDQTLEYI